MFPETKIHFNARWCPKGTASTELLRGKRCPSLLFGGKFGKCWRSVSGKIVGSCVCSLFCFLVGFAVFCFCCFFSSRFFVGFLSRFKGNKRYADVLEVVLFWSDFMRCSADVAVYKKKEPGLQFQIAWDFSVTWDEIEARPNQEGNTRSGSEEPANQSVKAVPEDWYNSLKH